MAINETRVDDLVRRIHSTPHKACLAVSGVGTQALAWLFAVPGTSRTVLDAQIPYSRPALDEYVGARAQQHVSAEEALKMAAAALNRAEELARLSGGDPGTPLVGLGCTAAIATDRVRRGDNRVHVAWSKRGAAKAYSLVFIKDGRSRKGEEEVGSVLVLNALSEAFGLSERLQLDLLPGETVTTTDG